GDTFDIFDADAFSGSFTLNLPALAGELQWNTSQLTVDGTISVAAISGAPQPKIVSLTGAGTTSVIVTWSNTVTGTNYVLQHNTNVAATNWTSLSPVTATGITASQTNNPP